MMTTERITEALSRRSDEITEVQASPKGFVHGRLANEVDPARPYLFVVDPVAKKQVLKVCVLEIARVRREGAVAAALARVNAQLRCGSAGIQDGEVLFQINYFCPDEQEGGPSGALFERLLDEAVAAVRFLERMVLMAQMLESGIPKSCAEKVMMGLFPEGTDEEQPAPSDTL